MSAKEDKKKKVKEKKKKETVVIQYGARSRRDRQTCQNIKRETNFVKKKVCVNGVG